LGCVARAVLEFGPRTGFDCPLSPRCTSWNTTAILAADDAPGFDVNKDGSKLQFIYVLQNATNADYEIGSETDIKIVVRTNGGSLTEPLPKETATLRRPVFIPAQQKAISRLSIALGNIPQKKADETNEEYHERLRAFCREHLGNNGFVLFDDFNRYQINLPSVRAEKLQKPS
jgi:hypothetical protein